MTKKHFELIARRIHQQVERAGGNKAMLAMLNELACDLAFSFRAVNPNFDQERFLRACGF